MLKRISGLRDFCRDTRGLAALEFAFVVPVMITMLFGMVEVSRLLNCRAGIAQLAGTVGDLVAQASAPNTADITNVYRAANTILYPYYDPGDQNAGSKRPAIRITSVIYDTATGSATDGKVAWSCTQTGSAGFAVESRAPNSKVTLTQGLLSSGGSVLMVEVAYNYVPPTTEAITGTFLMRDNFYTKPRRVAQIPPPGCPT